MLKDNGIGVPAELTATAVLAALVYFVLRLLAPRAAKILDEREERLRLADAERLERFKILEAEVERLRATELEQVEQLAECRTQCLQREKDVARLSVQVGELSAQLMEAREQIKALRGSR